MTMQDEPSLVQDAPQSPAPRIHRRAFLIGTGVTFGLCIGYVLWPHYPQLRLPTGHTETLLSGWIKIGPTGQVVIIVPQAEMGQGVYTALPMLVAEELGAAWENVSVEPAPLHPLYVNKFIAEDMVKQLPPLLQGAARWAMGDLIERFDVHITGGSTSVRNSYDPLRRAGAIARVMLCKAAATIWGVDWQHVNARNGMLHHGDKKLSFAQVAPKVQAEDPPEDVPLKNRKDHVLIGKSVPRLDIPAKVRGAAIFGIDVRMPDLVYAAINQGPIGSGHLLPMDPEHIPQKPAGVIDIVRGDTWCAVVAERYWLARTHLEALPIAYSPQQVDTVHTEWAHDRLRNAYINGKPHVYEHDGTLDFDPDIPIVSAYYEVPYLAHACMEPMNATARFNSDGTLEIWAPTQSISLVARAVADDLAMDIEKIVVKPTFLGGGFGRKAEPDACLQAARIAQKVKRPVQVIWSREQDFEHDRFRPMAIAGLRAQLSPEGKITSFHFRAASQSCSGSVFDRVMPKIATHEPDGSSVQGATHLPYHMDNRLIEHVVEKMPIPVGFWRSVGHSQNAFFIESFIDELAHAAQQDPADFRLAHLEKDSRHANALRMAMGKIGPKPTGHGHGYALHESFGSIVVQVADVSVDKGGALIVHQIICVVDCGEVVHPDTVRGQIEGGIIFGLSAAQFGKINFANGRTEQTNFDSYPLLNLAQTPDIRVYIVESGAPRGGIGEVAVPCVAPAIANALFDARKLRIRTLPLSDHTLNNTANAST